MIWFFASTLLGLAYVTPNINRVNLIFLPMIVFTAGGIAWLGRRLGVRWRGVGHGVVAAVVLLYVTSFARFATAYFTEFPEQSSPVFFEGLGEAIEFVSGATEGPICVTGMINAPYIFVLFYTKTDPRVFLKTARFSGPIWGIWTVDAFDRYTFGPAHCGQIDTAALILHRTEAASWRRAGDVVRTFKNYVAVVPRSATNPAGR